MHNSKNQMKSEKDYGYILCEKTNKSKIYLITNSYDLALLEKSRLEKISTLQEVNKLKAKNASHGLDLMSSTNQMAYEDVWNLGDLNSDLIKKEYDYNANSYFNQANSYLNQANNYKKQYKQSVFDYSLNALGKIGQVASEWYENREKGGLENGFF